MSDLFKPSDFDFAFRPSLGGIADHVNYLYKLRVLDKAMKVTGAKIFGPWIFSERPFSSDTHSALLINIEPFKKEECKHEMEFAVNEDGDAGITGKCKHCNKKLKAEWIAVE